MQQALEYIERHAIIDGIPVRDALRAALANELFGNSEELVIRPEQGPLEYWNAVEGWVRLEEVREHFDSVGCGTIYKTAGEDRVPLYTSPQREWVGLTDDEIGEALMPVKVAGVGYYLRSARAIEAALKEKNT
jgi:hypothetical protein